MAHLPCDPVLAGIPAVRGLVRPGVRPVRRAAHGTRLPRLLALPKAPAGQRTVAAILRGREGHGDAALGAGALLARRLHAAGFRAIPRPPLLPRGREMARRPAPRTRHLSPRRCAHCARSSPNRPYQKARTKGPGLLLLCRKAAGIRPSPLRGSSRWPLLREMRLRDGGPSA